MINNLIKSNRYLFDKYYLYTKGINADQRSNLYFYSLCKYKYKKVNIATIILKKIFHKFNYDIDFLDDEITYILVTYLKNKDLEIISRNLKSKLQTLNFNDCSYFNLIEFSNLLKKMGLFNIAIIFINAAEKNLQKKNLSKLNKIEVNKLIGICILNNNYKKVDEIINIRKEFNEKARYLSKIIFKKNPIIKIDPTFENFARYVHNKSICLVCSSSNNFPNGIDIDSHEIVCRYNTKNFNFDRKNQGSKTNICFFSSGLDHLKDKDINNNIIKFYDWIVLKNPHIHSQIDKSYFKKSVYIDTLYDEFFNGTLMNLQRSILFFQKYTNVTLNSFNCDLHYSIEYSKDSATNNIIKMRNYFLPMSSVSHDPLTHLRIMRIFNDNKLINADSQLNKILTRTDNENMEILTKLYQIENFEIYKKLLRTHNV